MRATLAISLLGFSVICCQMSAHESNNPNFPDPQTADSLAGDDAMTDREPMVADLEETHWQLEEYLSEAGEMVPVLEDATADIKFDNAGVGGSAGCNRYFGQYSLGADNALELAAQRGMTQMACPPPIDAQERQYLAALGHVSAWDRDESSLGLLDAAGQTILRFIAIQPPTLEATEWQATGINNGTGGVVSTETTDRATAVFEDGQVSGNGGCNQFHATYEIDGERITIGPAAATRKLCAEPEGIMDQEQEYLSAFSRATTYTLARDKLELRDEGGALQVGFRMVPGMTD